jgi:hypothetical protein
MGEAGRGFLERGTRINFVLQVGIGMTLETDALLILVSNPSALLNNGMKVMLLNDLKLRSKSSCFSATPPPVCYRSS